VTAVSPSFGHTSAKLDSLVDSLVVHALKSEQADASGSEENSGGALDAGSIASKVGKPKSDWLLLHEGELILKLQDVNHAFSVEELIRLRNVVSSVPSRCYKNLESIKEALLYHPKLIDFQEAFQMPCMRTRMPDGSVGANRVSTASRHGRLAEAICLALDVAINSRKADVISLITVFAAKVAFKCKSI